ncbi:hypothetical protein C0J52_15296 [Blattella germanica]|nr:hypothetical protein C0J52_15296 [Blattella germanica]
MFEYAHVLKVILMYLSHMFRDVDIPFLRYLSQFFTSEYYMPGDIIYKTLDLKTKMIYVVGGVIQQTSEFDSQRVCLTGNFPWILKPESPFLKVWDRIILCDILITTAIIPYNAVYLMNMTIAAVVLMFSSLYICDIYIQMTTAFLTRDGLVTSLRPLLYLKFMNVPFLVDFVGSFPLELVIYLLNENGDIAASFVFLQINRILRIWKFEQFFNALENTLYSKVWHFRILKYTFYVILAIYFYGCVLFKETCPT